MEFTLLKDYRYIAQIGTEKHTLQVEQLVVGRSAWLYQFRVCIPAADNRAAETIYGWSADEVAEKGAAYMSKAAAKASEK